VSRFAGATIREASAGDELFLREMLYQSLYVPEGAPPFDRQILNEPDIAKYVDGWGRAGDIALIAEDRRNNEAVGAVWLRTFNSANKAYGYVGDNIPELAIAVLPEYRGCGVGTTLLDRAIQTVRDAGYGAISLSVSAGNPAQRLYTRLGFETVSTSGNSLTMLKRLRTEPEEVQHILRDFRRPWGVAGGWALDLFLGRVTRKHADIEVAIFREDQLALREYLSSLGWSFEYVRSGELFPWPAAQKLNLPIHEIWCSNSMGPLRRLEVLLNERESDEFVFRRNSQIRVPVRRTFLTHSADGVPFLAPEIVLLYKSKNATDSKEQLDFVNALDSLGTDVHQRLSAALTIIDPGHPWLAALTASSSRGAGEV
jgi:ribosomal protein S18 acetylase RimI-like enzyme